MKQVQIDKVLDSVEVDGALDGESVQVSSVGPLTVAVQLSASNNDSVANCEAQLQGSLDGVNFFDVGSPVAIADNGEFIATDKEVAFAHYRVQFSADSGSIDVVQRFFVYGETL